MLPVVGKSANVGDSLDLAGTRSVRGMFYAREDAGSMVIARIAMVCSLCRAVRSVPRGDISYCESAFVKHRIAIVFFPCVWLTRASTNRGVS